MQTEIQTQDQNNDSDSKAIVAFNAALTHEKADTVILCDCSTSMLASLPGKNTSRMEAMRNCLLRIVGAMDKAAVLLFASRHCLLTSWANLVIESASIGWGTNLGSALRRARRLNPSHIIVITDGEANSPVAALDEARSMLCKIDVYYCGPGRPESVEFCNSLAQYGGQAIIDPECVTMLESVKLFLCDAIKA